MISMTISDGSSLTVLAASACDTDLVAYEMTLLVEAVGEALTPELRTSRGAQPAVRQTPLSGSTPAR
jgi:hypothetical protein